MPKKGIKRVYNNLIKSLDSVFNLVSPYPIIPSDLLPTLTQYPLKGLMVPLKRLFWLVIYNEALVSRIQWFGESL
jgi:hypothetical protein